MKLFKKLLCLSLFFSISILIGCDSTNIENKLPKDKPKDINFIFSYGVDSKNKLDTIKGQFTKDMITEPSVTINLKLSEQDMDNIYSEIRRINILDYPDSFKPKDNVMQKPYYTYNFQIISDGINKSISWEDNSDSQSEDAIQLRELFKKIQQIIESKEEYKKLPKASTGYN